MTTPVPLDDTSAVHTTTTFDLHYTVTGPPVPIPFGSTSCCPEIARVRVVSDLEGTRAQRLTVWGARAKKDGTAGMLHSEADFWMSLESTELPDYLRELISQAEIQVRRWLAA